MQHPAVLQACSGSMNIPIPLKPPSHAPGQVPVDKRREAETTGSCYDGMILNWGCR